LGKRYARTLSGIGYRHPNALSDADNYPNKHAPAYPHALVVALEDTHAHA